MGKRRNRHVWLALAGDTPVRAFASESLADDFCMEANARNRVEVRGTALPRVYYRWYKLELEG